MTDEQNISLEEKNQADEVMKEVLQDAKLEDLFHQMP
jgi:ABC-type transport system involved in cytochrome bd biosynthesis fused ATPase/permease subunit